MWIDRIWRIGHLSDFTQALVDKRSITTLERLAHTIDILRPFAKLINTTLQCRQIAIYKENTTNCLISRQHLYLRMNNV